ncbi:FAS1 domain-containing protein [Nemania sp. FL0916]|nr:FAS1 domain-containing protein [Nemania sp. FL0916]
MMLFKELLLLNLLSIATAQSPTSLTDALGSQNSSLSSLNTLLQQNPQYLSALGSTQNVTFLAPNNDAVAAFMNSTNSSSSSLSPGDLGALLSYHVLNGTYYPSNITNTSQFIPTQLLNTTFTNLTDGQRVECLTRDNNVTFISALKQNISAVNGNVNFTNGTIYIVNGVLSIPQNLTNTLTNANLTAAVGAINAANQTTNLTQLSNATIFAPNNQAFYAIGSLLGNQTTDQLKGITGYHVVNGTVAYSPDLKNQTLRAQNGEDINISVINGTVFANSARVTVPDVLYGNGVVHVIDQVLNPSNTTASPNPSATTAGPAYPGASSDTTGFPFTSGVTTPTSTYPAATSAGGGTPARGAAAPMQTGAVHYAALFGGAAMLANL